MEEIWKDIAGYEGRYEVSNFGRIKSYVKKKVFGKILSPYLCGEYYAIRLFFAKNRIGKVFFIHKLMAQAFIPNPDNKPEVNHENGIKTDNWLWNFKWVTKSENIQHAYDTGLLTHVGPKGEKSPTAKLKSLQIEEIRKSILEGKSHREIAREFNTSSTNVSFIRNNKRWAA